MQIFLQKNGEQSGPFTREEIQAQLDSGEISPANLAWRKGMAAWQPIRHALDETPRAAIPPQRPAEPLSAWQYYLYCWKNILNFKGRARRREYWNFVLFELISILLFMIGIGILSLSHVLLSISGSWLVITELMMSVMILSLGLPRIAAGIRRLHDTNRSGWWYAPCLIHAVVKFTLLSMNPIDGTYFFFVLLPYYIVMLVFLCLDSTPGENRFGPNPKMLDS